LDDEYYQQGKLHRSDGPAMTKQTEQLLYWSPNMYWSPENAIFSTVELPGGRFEIMQTFYKEGKQVPSF
jgi:hypothetical protein